MQKSAIWHRLIAFLLFGGDVDPAFHNSTVAAVFDGFPAESRAGLLALRRLIFECAAERPEIGAITETLKWGQPAYSAEVTHAGTTLRLGVPKTGGYAIYVHCQTTVVPQFRDMFSDAFSYDGNRAVLFDAPQAPDLEKLRFLVMSALCYHLDKRHLKTPHPDISHPDTPRTDKRG
mgnify:CR=1 FL=1